MTAEKQQQIASSFSDTFEEFNLAVSLSTEEFSLFDKGVFSKSMEDKWNVFVVNDVMYWARSWTHHCIFKIHLIRKTDQVTLEKGFVTRNKNQYNSDDIEQDKIHFLKILQHYLGRDDIYVDPAFQFDLIKQTLSLYQPARRYKKSIGRQSVKSNKLIYETMLRSRDEHLNATGWADFYTKIKDMNDDDDILSLYLHNKETNRGTTYYFDKEGKVLLGVIVPIEQSGR